MDKTYENLDNIAYKSLDDLEKRDGVLIMFFAFERFEKLYHDKHSNYIGSVRDYEILRLKELPRYLSLNYKI